MVLGTFIAAPLMAVSAQMATTTPSTDEVETIVSVSTRAAAAFGFVAVAVFAFVEETEGMRHAHKAALDTLRTTSPLHLLRAVRNINLQLAKLVRFARVDRTISWLQTKAREWHSCCNCIMKIA